MACSLSIAFLACIEVNWNNLTMKKLLIFFILTVSPFSQAQLDVTFNKGKIKLGQQTISVEIADSPERAERGLMFRKTMPENEGMIFVFADERPRAFWMKNTYLPLTIAYIGKNKKIVDLQDMKPAPTEASPPSYPSKKPAMYALEMNQGWFNKNKVKVGDQFQWLEPKGK
jgi:uncharacterized membrane protein (UPF0127 family)